MDTGLEGKAHSVCITSSPRDIAWESPLAHPASQDHPIPQNHTPLTALAEPGGWGLNDGVRARLIPFCDWNAELEQPSGLVPQIKCIVNATPVQCPHPRKPRRNPPKTEDKAPNQVFANSGAN